MPLEHPLEMGLVGEAGVQRHFDDRAPAPEFRLAKLNAAIGLISVRRQAVARFESPHQMEGRQSCRHGDLGQAQGAGAILGDKIGGAGQSRMCSGER